MKTVTQHRVKRMVRSLQGLAIGDAFGEVFATRARSARSLVENNNLPPPKWHHTDDTAMALCVVEMLAATGRVTCDELAWRFALRYRSDPDRGYGRGARRLLEQILSGQPWRDAAATVFSGGSKGNGAAMRVAPLGAFFAGEIDQTVAAARDSAIVTHSHPEGIAGAIAVAVAASVASWATCESLDELRERIWQAVLDHTPPGETLDGLTKAKAVPAAMEPEFAARLLGSGFLVTAPDTVPFAIWCASRHIDNYREAILATIAGDGDCDTNCAIVGGIVACYAESLTIPDEWKASAEPVHPRLPDLPHSEPAA